MAIKIEIKVGETIAVPTDLKKVEPKYNFEDLVVAEGVLENHARRFMVFLRSSDYKLF